MPKFKIYRVNKDGIIKECIEDGCNNIPRCRMRCISCYQKWWHNKKLRGKINEYN